MKLFYRFYPNNNEPQNQNDLNNKQNPKTIIILHGLFGSSKNWISISKELSNHFNVYALDLRNHGDSPHSTQFSLLDMVDDLEEFLLDHKIDSPILLGIRWVDWWLCFIL
jgi:esterase